MVLVDEWEPRHRSQTIEIRDTRRRRPGDSWLEVLQERLARFLQDGLPFALLLIETVDRQGSPALEDALRAELGPLDLLCEDGGRHWLIVPEVDWRSARALAERLARAAGISPEQGERPASMFVGIAVCPQHGRDPATLRSHAQIDAYAARAAGTTVAPVDDPIFEA